MALPLNLDRLPIERCWRWAARLLVLEGPSQNYREMNIYEHVELQNTGKPLAQDCLS